MQHVYKERYKIQAGGESESTIPTKTVCQITKFGIDCRPFVVPRIEERRGAGQGGGKTNKRRKDGTQSNQ